MPTPTDRIYNDVANVIATQMCIDRDHLHSSLNLIELCDELDIMDVVRAIEADVGVKISHEDCKRIDGTVSSFAEAARTATKKQ